MTTSKNRSKSAKNTKFKEKSTFLTPKKAKKILEKISAEIKYYPISIYLDEEDGSTNLDFYKCTKNNDNNENLKELFSEIMQKESNSPEALEFKKFIYEIDELLLI